MARTQGQGNPHWIFDEVVLALDLYNQCKDSLPSSKDVRVIDLSNVLKSMPVHSQATKNIKFRNPEGVAFKLQNLRQLDSGKGLGNVSQTDRKVWEQLGKFPEETRRLANLIQTALEYLTEFPELSKCDHEFAEGRILTALHTRRERDPRVRIKLLENRRRLGKLYCEICSQKSPVTEKGLDDAIFEAHHIKLLSKIGEVSTKLEDIALLCACCHRLIHRLISQRSQWVSVQDARNMLCCDELEKEKSEFQSDPQS